MIDDLDFSKSCMDPSEVNYVIYHNNCTDGFGSALCAYKYFENYPSDKRPMYHGGKFGTLPPLDDIKNKCVLICDFSYKWLILQKLCSVVKKLLILDHHKTAVDDLKELPDSNKIFTMNHSGAYITWRFFFRNQPVPLGILYIEDNDLWAKKMPNTNEFTATVFSLPFTFEEYGKLLDENYINDKIIPMGKGILQHNTNIIERSLKYVVPKFMLINDKYYFIAYLNTTELKSELGNKSFTIYPNINFSVMYSHNDHNNSTIYSLRSLDTASDVSEIAKFFGGGGHRNASGATCNYITNILPGKVIDDNKTYSLLNNIYSKTYIIGENSYNIVCLNSSHHKHQLAKYLLQIRYSTQNKNIQECVSIMKNRNSDINKYDMSIIWNYDGFNNCTWFTVFYDQNNNILKDQLLDKFKNYENFKYENEVFVFSSKLFINFIPKMFDIY